MKKIALFIMVSLFVFMTSAYTVRINPKVEGLNDPAPFYDMDFDGTYDWEVAPDSKTSSTDYITYSDLRTNYIIPIQNSTESIANLLTYVSGKFIRFDTAEELYDFSMDVSFIEQFTTYNETEELYELNPSIDESLVTTLLGLDYVLGRDLDYSVMESRSIDPIGYDFTFQGTSYSNYFTGTFNGQGFEIENLYLSGYDRIILTDTIGEPIDIPLSPYYAMFNYNTGQIRNLGLINPNLEILQVNDELTKLANLVGENDGTVDHVYVIDQRESVTEAGIRYRVGNTPKIFSAAGIVHTNNANLSNAYYASKIVVNGNFINKFDLEPIVFNNQAPGTTTRIVYDSDRYLINVQVGSSIFTINTPTQGVGETTALIKSSASSLNPGDWYFYPDDGYPILQGLVYNSGYYEISNAKDLAFFPEVIDFNSELNGLNFIDANYRLVNDIDMSVLAPGIYQTPSSTFNGEFIGTNDSAIDQSDHYYIYNLHQTTYLAVNSKLYAGLFSVLGNGSLVKHINIIDSSIVLGETGDFYSYNVFVGSIAGEMIAGTIEDVYVDMDIDLGQEALGSIHVGGIVGQASGVIQRVSNNGLLNVNAHTYTVETSPVNGQHYIGGIVGQSANAKLVLNEVANRGNIQSFDTSSSVTLLTGVNLNIYTGGVIGYINYNDLYQPEFNEIVNSGDITLYSVSNPANNSGMQYMGGVIGLLEGDAPLLEEDSEILFANFMNEGNVIYDYDASSIGVYASGILNANIDEVYELALLKNYGTFDYDITGAPFTHFNYAGIINDIGNDDLTLTRVYQYGNQTYDSSIYSQTFGMVVSENNNDIFLRYSSNYGDVYFMDNAGNTTISLTSDVKISAITEEDNVDYLNVHNYGNIDVVNINTGSNDLYIAGFSSQLSLNRILENSLNAGNITFADISGSGLIFVAGFVNRNLSGDLESFALGATQPIATEGVLNSINAGDISTTYNSTRYGVDGTNNTFVGGLVTLNKKTIQDSANLGNISLVNTNGSTTFTFETNQSFGGLTTSFTGGIVAGGVAAMVIDGNSRIFDTGNSGNVIGKAQQFVRTGGVLGVSLYQESTSGGITSAMGLVDTIQNSILSNGLNFGDISAVTSVIATYDTTTYIGGADLYINSSTTSDMGVKLNTTLGTQDRPAVYAASGGVIGYGLSVMRNMMNHGTISSTDVAGGVVGATYALGATSGSFTTVVNISTAVNYGTIKSISNASYNSISNISFSIDTIDDFYMSDNNTFIYPTGFTPESPASKRGFGGIFGRLQRGLNGVMTSSGGAFDFIVNANPNIDLIGRLDQVLNFSSSGRYFRFNDAIYYSAKENDTTQTVFSGFYFEIGTITSRTYNGYFDNVWNFTATADTVDTVRYQQGIVNSFIETINPSETRNFTTIRTQGVWPFSVGDRAEIFVGTKPVPWITEDPNDPLITDSDTQYIYDPDFEMRTNPDLTEYIYYVEAELLADRFQASGENPRPNGMYVLSTSAGQTFGSVLPRNIDRQAIELIDESTDFTLLSDYSNVSSVTLNLDVSIVDAYNDLRQTNYSDQANMIDDVIKQEFIIQETSESGNTLIANDISNYLGTGVDLGIDYVNNVITLAISMESFAPSQTSASFDITSALTSANALIGIRASEYNLLDDLIISEYVEGSDGNNDNAIEIYNGTGSDVDLSNYSLRIYRSGATSPGTTINLSGTLASGDTYVLVNNLAPQEMLDLADQIEVMRYNGDDAIALVNGTTNIDVFGVIGQDPGMAWTWTGGGSSMEITLVRNASTLAPTTSWDTSQWTVYPSDTIDYLGEHTVYLKDLSDQLYIERYTDIASASNTKADLTIDLPNYNITSSTLQTLGWFSVYSEAFYMDSLNGTYEFLENLYYNDYRIDILFLPNLSQSTNTTGIDTVAFNGGGNINITTASSIDVRATGTVNYNGSLRLNFIDENDILVPGYDFKDNFELYFNDGTLVPDTYYSITSIPVDGAGNYSITFTLSEDIRSGDYYLEYSYFPTSTTYRVDFDKAPSTNNDLIDFSYQTENGSVPSTITSDFDSLIDIGVTLNIDANNTHITQNTNPVSYLPDSFDISYMTNGSLVISPFAEVISAIKTGETYANGYLVHQLQYVIEAENGAQATYTHEIFERTVNIEQVQKNNNIVPIDDAFATREANATVFTIDLGLNEPINDASDFYGDPNTVFTVDVVDDLGATISYQGITWSFGEFLNITMTIDTEPGDYYFDIRYIAGGRNIQFLTPTANNLKVTKNQGTDAYLSDIRFSEFANETNYPQLSARDEFGNVLTQYEPQAYFNGFDYDGAKIDGVQYFRIDGEVSNVPLDDYTPIFEDFLPIGSTIEKREWDDVNSVWFWTTDLSADFTRDPQTGLEPGPTQDKVTIRYRVTSEDGLNEVFYDISVTDVVFNVTFIFNIYYCSDGLSGSCVLAKDSIDFNQELVIINVQNILTDGLKPAVGDDPSNYPTFSEVTGLENKTIQFFYTDSPNYNYRFARNKSFFYNLSVELPLDDYLNDLYDYDIEFEIGSEQYFLNDASDYVPGLQGKYFYIQDSINLRTRRFNVYIYPIETPSTDKPFGLFDFFRTWS
jgi:hypothetical protein